MIASSEYRLLFEKNPLPMWVFDRATLKFLAVNDSAVRHYGWTREEFLSKTILDIRPDEDGPAVRAALGEHGDHYVEPEHWRHCTSTGEIIDVEVFSDAIAYEGRPARLVCVVDITAARASEARFRSLIHHATDAVVVANAEMRCIYASPAIVDVLGYEPAEAMGRPCMDFVHPDDYASAVEHFQEALHHLGTHPPFEHRCRRKNGSEVHVQVTMTNLVEESSVGGVVVNLRDITERKQIETELAHRALHDPLTALPNRELFHDRLTVALARARRSHTLVTVLFLDLDRFKLVNDSLGHDAGDRLLCAVGERLRSVLRASDTVARFGGDEFAVLCEDVPDERETLALAKRVVDTLSEPFVLDRHEIVTTASVGIALSSGSTDRPETLLRDADAAMYRAKERGRSRYEVFDDDMRARSVRWIETEAALRRALDRGELALAYQPCVSLRDGRVISFEALLRWNADSAIAGISPGELVALAEETGLIFPVGAFVLDTACRQLAAWDKAGFDTSVAVNVSARQLAHPELFDNLARALSDSQIEPRRLCLEITESVLMDDLESSLEALYALRSLGVRIAIDDFGTGYSSLTYLRRFPVDVLKLDREFVRALGSSDVDHAIVAAVVTLAGAMRVTAVAEGVETHEQLAALRDLGCDAAQGYLFARPLAVDAATDLLQRGGPLLPPARRAGESDAGATGSG